MYDFNRNVLILSDGCIARIGDRVWIKASWLKPTPRCITINHVVKLTTETITTVHSEDEIKDVTYEVVDENGFSHCLSKLCKTKKNALKVQIACGKFVGVGDTVWIWREGNQPALVSKIVCAVKRQAYGLKLQCTYADNFWPRVEDSNNLYGSKSAAIKAKPIKAKQLEQSLIRQGRIQGKNFRKAS